MSRHRDVRSMNYSDEYDGYDDVYGHSVEDDISMSPGAEQFLYDRNKQQNMASFLTEPDITEADEDDTQKRPELSELDTVKLVSCMEVIRNVIGDEMTEAMLTEEIIKANFDAEIALDKILKSTSSLTLSDTPVAVQRPELQPPVDLGAIAKQITPSVQVSTAGVRVIPAATKTVVKGFTLSTTNDADNLLLHPSLDSSRPQSPAFNNSQPNSPRQHRKDDLNIYKKNLAPSTSTTPRCQSPLSGRGTPEIESRVKSQEDKRDALEIYKKNRGDMKEQLNLVVVGHVDAGKSTLLGRLLCALDQVSKKLIHKYHQESQKIGKQSFAYAWVLDETSEERERGITMDVGYSKFETESKTVTLLDAPGHKDFIPNMITGATQADVALLVVDATRGEFETGFDSGGQTREHALLLRSLGVSQLAVVVNKLDTVDWSQDRFNEIVNKMSVFLKQAGFGDKVVFVPCSGLSGENLVSQPTVTGLSSWYSGPTLLGVIDSFKCPERPVNKPLRFSVNDIFKGIGSGFCVSGHVETGMVAVSDKVLVLPQNEMAVVKGMQTEEGTLKNAFAGDNVSLTLSGFDQENVGIGDIICSPSRPIPVTSTFQAHIVIFAIAIPITIGINVVIHAQSLVEPAIITKLISQLHKGTGEIIKKKPRVLPKNSSAVVEITTNRPICLELYKDVKQLGRIMIRYCGTTVAAGLVTKIK